MSNEATVGISFAAITAAGIALGLGYIVARQARRIARINVKLRALHETGAEMAVELHNAMAHNDELAVRVDELEDQHVRILNSWMEAS